MPISLRVPAAGAQLAIISPAKAQPNQLYLLGFKGGEQGPIVMARQQGNQIQLGPLPENTDPASIERLTQLPPVARLEVEGLLTEDHPTPARVIAMIAQHAAQKHVLIYL